MRHWANPIPSATSFWVHSCVRGLFLFAHVVHASSKKRVSITTTRWFKRPISVTEDTADTTDPMVVLAHNLVLFAKGSAFSLSRIMSVLHGNSVALHFRTHQRAVWKSASKVLVDDWSPWNRRLAYRPPNGRSSSSSRYALSLKSTSCASLRA